MLKIGNYIIKPETSAVGWFNLFQEWEMKDKEGNLSGKMNEKPIAFAVKLSRIMDIISEDRTLNEDHTDLREFVKAKESHIRVLLEQFNERNNEIYKELRDKEEN